MAEQQAGPGEAEYLAGQDIPGLPKRKYWAPHDPDEYRDVPDPDSQGAVEPAGPRAVTMASASTMAGIAKSMSVARMMTTDVQWPK